MRHLAFCSRRRHRRCPRASLRIIPPIALWLLAVAPALAAEVAYKDFAKAAEPWKRGFVYGISRYMMTVAQPDEEAPYPVRTAFQRCLTDASDTALLRHVETYVARNSAVAKGPMTPAVVRALFELCRLDIDKPKPPAPR